MGISDHEQKTLDQLGLVARNLYEALRELGYDRSLGEVAREMPDARERLVYVGQMTEAAAHKVLASVEAGMPECNQLAEQGRDIAQTIRRRCEGEISASMIKATFNQFADFAERASNFAELQNRLLSEIMMTQDFQDLSGQVIKKVVDIITRTERELLEILVVSMPNHAVELSPQETLQGPQVPDKALKQNEVDDLLANLGF